MHWYISNYDKNGHEKKHTDKEDAKRDLAEQLTINDPAMSWARALELANYYMTEAERDSGHPKTIYSVTVLYNSGQ